MILSTYQFRAGLTKVKSRIRAATSQRNLHTRLSHYLKEWGPSVDSLFDAAWYLSENPDVAASKMDPLFHYIKYGRFESRSPSVLFDARFYIAQKPEIAERRLDPLCDYLGNGGFKNLDPNRYFSSEWYLEQYEDARISGICPLLHYISIGECKGYWPSENFQPESYRLLHSEQDWSQESPLAHFLKSNPLQPAIDRNNFRSFQALRQFIGETTPGLQPRVCSVELRVESVQRALANTGIPLDRLPASGEAIGPPPEFPGQPYVARLSDAFVVGGSRYVLSNQNLLLHDEEAYFCGDAASSIKAHFAQRLPNRRLKLKVGVRSGAWLESGINMMHEYSNNYFHFVAETLPRMLLVEEAKIPQSVPFLFEAGLYANLMTLIDIANISRRPVHFLESSTVYSVRDLYLPSDVSSVPDAYFGGAISRKSVLDVERIRRITRRCQESFPVEGELPRSGRRIFVGRSGKLRVLLNQKELEAKMVKMGFEILRVDDLNLEAQIRIFRQAEIIIAPTGAQITNIVWCRPGTELIVLASDFPGHQLYLWELLGKVARARNHIVLGPRAFAVDGKYAVHDDYSVDPESVTSLVAEIIGNRK
uniref:glycosyltransferase family 61 protein n=1 Tax=Cupriavidus taiwanensis TaxID=164546 RepID=UPI000E2FF38E|nr:glycosyltransferase family 61 protein [Cupriavidus taiwanensis]